MKTEPPECTMGLFKSHIKIIRFKAEACHFCVTNETIKTAFLYMTSACRAWEANSLLVLFGVSNDKTKQFMK